MKVMHKGIEYPNEDYVSLLETLEEYLARMLSKKWKHKWSCGHYDDGDYDRLNELISDILQTITIVADISFSKNYIESVEYIKSIRNRKQ